MSAILSSLLKKRQTMIRVFVFLNFLLAFVHFSCKNEAPKALAQNKPQPVDSAKLFQNEFKAKLARSPIAIDGKADEPDWAAAEWLDMEQRWLGPAFSKDDFSGRYKLLWQPAGLFVLAEIVDDTLVDFHKNGLEKYWDDDCLEIFIDENASGGLHQYNYNAFAYHIALDGKTADIGADSLPLFLSDHVRSARKTDGKTTVWEVEMKIFDDRFSPKNKANKPVLLEKGKKMGFAIAYCDNDRSPERENFVGSVFVGGPDKNRGWIDASIFGKLELIE